MATRVGDEDAKGASASDIRGGVAVCCCVAAKFVPGMRGKDVTTKNLFCTRTLKAAYPPVDIPDVKVPLLQP